MSRVNSVVLWGLVAGLLALTAQPSVADLSGFVGTIDFAKDLDRSLGFGLRWGRSSGVIGAETAVMIAMPERHLGDTKATATTIFYEGRMLVNIPVRQVSPFFGIGFGQIVITSNEVPRDDDRPDNLSSAFKVASKLQRSNAFSYGGGLRYGLNNRVDLRADLRRYVVFSVAGFAVSTINEEIKNKTGNSLPVEPSTVSYEEVSVGVNIRF